MRSSAIIPALALFQHVAFPQTPPMHALKKYYLAAPIVQSGRPACVIVAPEGEPWLRLGKKIQDRIRELSGAVVPLETGVQVTKTMRSEPNMILLGHFDNNPAVQSLYHQHYVFADAQYPGPNGYELRTVHDPNAEGTCHVYLGSSDLDGAQMAVEAFLPMLKGRRDIRIPHTIRVVVNGAEPPRLSPDQIQKKVDAIKGRKFRTAANTVTRSGLAYHRTGDPGQAEVFKRGVPIWAGTFANWNRVDDSRGAVEITLVWDLIEESAIFTDKDRAAISWIMWEYAQKSPGSNRPIEVAPTPRGNNWNARGDWMTAHYWMKYYKTDVAGLHVRSVNWFAAQERWWKPKEDCPGYGSITTYDLLTYALSARDFDYFISGKAKTMADYGMVITNNLGHVCPFGDMGGLARTYHWPEALQVATWYYRDGRYHWFLDNVMGHVPAGSSTLGYNHYSTDQVIPEEPKDILGVRVFPLENWIYDHRGRVLGTAPAAANVFLDGDPTPVRRKCFDKVSFRHNFDANGEYLLIGGISHGYHAHPDGNAVICFTDEGKHWLFDAGYFVPDTIEHNTIAIYRDGLFEPMPRLTSLEAHADFDRVGLTQTKLAHYNGADWRRNIVWVKDRFFLFVDEIEALEAGSFGLQCIWRTIGDVTLAPDRFVSKQGLSRFCLINGNEAKLKLTTTTPRTRDRHAIAQSQTADLKKGEVAAFLNIFYCADTSDGFPYEIARADKNCVLVKLGSDDYAYAGTGRVEIARGPRAEASVFYATHDELYMAGGKRITWEGCDVQGMKPINAYVNQRRGFAVVEVTDECEVALAAGGQTVSIDGSRMTPVSAKGTVACRLNRGRHVMRFSPASPALARTRRRAMAARWDDLWADHQLRLAKAHEAGGQAAAMATLWKVTNQTEQTRTLYRSAKDGEEQSNLAQEGKAKAWTPGSAGCSARRATDGDRHSYSAVSSSAPHTRDAPKDLGVEWTRSVRISQIWIEHYSNQYRPAEDGQDLQYWDGKRWVSIEDHIEGTDTPVWVHTFRPIETTRIRIFITKFNTSRTAIRELMVFGKPVKRVEEKVTIGQKPSDLCLFDLDRDGRAEVILATDRWVRVFGADGRKLWEQELPNRAHKIDAYGLNRDGKGEVVCSCLDAKLYCFDAGGKRLWAADCPKDQYTSAVEPRGGYFNVIKCDDLDGDGDGEVVAGSVNWFAYAFDHEGRVLWGTLNWAHPPLDIVTIDLKDTGKKASLIGTRYCAANLFSHDGEKIGAVSVGYHGCATACAAGDMDGNGKPELIAGSRVGSVECREWQSTKSWSLFMGAEVTRALMTNLVGDEKPELVVGSRNSYVLAVDATGEILWKRNAGDAVIDLAAADLNGDGRDEIVAGCDDGSIVVCSHGGDVIARFRTGASVVALAAGDVDGDTIAEIGVAAADGTVHMLKLNARTN